MSVLVGLTIVMCQVSHKSEGHIHETQGHKTSSSWHKEEEKEEEERTTEKTGIILYVVVAMSCRGIYRSYLLAWQISRR